MSAYLMGRVFYTDLPSYLKLTLLALADVADDSGDRVMLGQKRLARKVGCTDRSVRTHLSELRKLGYIEKVGRVGGHGQDRYELRVDQLPTHEQIALMFPRRSRAEEMVEQLDHEPTYAEIHIAARVALRGQPCVLEGPDCSPASARMHAAFSHSTPDEFLRVEGRKSYSVRVQDYAAMCPLHHARYDAAHRAETDAGRQPVSGREPGVAPHGSAALAERQRASDNSLAIRQETHSSPTANASADGADVDNVRQIVVSDRWPYFLEKLAAQDTAWERMSIGACVRIAKVTSDGDVTTALSFAAERAPILTGSAYGWLEATSRGLMEARQESA